MAKYKFKYYVHDNYEVDEMVDHMVERGVPEEHAVAIAEKRPWYEVEFDCVYDTETGLLKWEGVRPT